MLIINMAKKLSYIKNMPSEIFVYILFSLTNFNLSIPTNAKS